MEKRLPDQAFDFIPHDRILDNLRNESKQSIIEVIIEHQYRVPATGDISPSQPVLYNNLAHLWLETYLEEGFNPNIVNIFRKVPELDVNGNRADRTLAFPPIVFFSMIGALLEVKLLLSHGANVNQVTDQNETALMAAYFRKDHEIIFYLLSKGADSSIETVDGVCLEQFNSYQTLIKVKYIKENLKYCLIIRKLSSFSQTFR